MRQVGAQEKGKQTPGLLRPAQVKYVAFRGSQKGGSAVRSSPWPRVLLINQGTL